MVSLVFLTRKALRGSSRAESCGDSHSLIGKNVCCWKGNDLSAKKTRKAVL